MSSRRNWFVIALHEKRLPAVFGTDVDDVGQQFDVRFSTDEVDRSAGAQDHSDGNRGRKNEAGEDLNVLEARELASAQAQREASPASDSVEVGAGVPTA